MVEASRLCMTPVLDELLEGPPGSFLYSIGQHNDPILSVWRGVDMVDTRPDIDLTTWG